MAFNNAKYATDYKEVIFQHAKNTNCNQPLFHFQQDSKYLPCNFYCSLLVCGRSFSTEYAYKTKEEAEYEVTKQACFDLNLLSLPQLQINNQNDRYGYQVPMVVPFVGHQNLQMSQTPGYDSSFSSNQMDTFSHIPHSMQTPLPLSDSNQASGIKDHNYYDNYPIEQSRNQGGNANKNQKTENTTNKPACWNVKQNLHQSFVPAGTKFNRFLREEPKQRNSFNENEPKPPKLQKSLGQVLSRTDTKAVSATNEPIQISKVDEIWQYLTDDIMATSFKSFLHIFSRDKQWTIPKYETYKTSENGINGFKGKVILEEKEYECIGMMRHKKQAELSASEVCLRTLGFLPYISNVDDFTIQPYRGGLIKTQIKQKSRCYTILTRISHHLGFSNSGYGVKQPNKNEEKYLGVCWLSNKIFESSIICSTIHEAKQKVCLQALDYLNVIMDRTTGFSQFLCKLTKVVKLHKALSPFDNVPSVNVGWLHKSIDVEENMSSYTGEIIDMDSLKEKLSVTSLNYVGVGDPYERFLHQTLVFNRVPIKSRADISVGEILLDNPHLVLIGNKDFSIKLYCKGRKIYCKQRKCYVGLMAGHHITGLECDCVTLPSLDVYLAAAVCNDLYFPNPSKPVIRSCHAILILHDQHARNSPYVLLQRTINSIGFVGSSFMLSDYLGGLITGKKDNILDLHELTAGIEHWKVTEVKLLSDMGMVSMQELYSQFQKYDNRWNEVFTRPLTADLQKLKSICLTELARRQRLKQPEPIVESKWELPKDTFRPRIISTGPFIERSSLCIIRGLRNHTGIRLSLADVDSLPFVDLPVSSNHTRGAFDRYYIWAKSKQVGEDGETPVDTYFEPCNVDFDSDEWVVKPSQAKRGKKSERLEHGQDNENKDDIKKPHEEEAEDVCNTEEQDSGPDQLMKASPGPFKSVTKECKWFSLSEATNLNVSFAQLIESVEFQSALNSLKNQRSS